MKIVILNEIKDSIEIVHTLEYSTFLSNMLPCFLNLLKNVSVSCNIESDEHVSYNLSILLLLVTLFYHYYNIIIMIPSLSLL